MARPGISIAMALVISVFCFSAAQAKEFNSDKGASTGTTKIRMGWEPGWKENFRANHAVGHKSPGFKFHKKGHKKGEKN